MARELSVIPLKCAGCGASVSVSEDMTRFACGYCGTEQMVERKGGTVALKPIADATGKVQLGTDKTAAELALARLPRERNALIWQRSQRSAYWEQQITNRKMKANNWELLVSLVSFVVIIPGLTVVFAGLTPKRWSGAFIGIVLGVVTSVGLVFYTNRRLRVGKAADILRLTEESTRDLATFDSQIRAMSQEIEENRRIANS